MRRGFTAIVAPVLACGMLAATAPVALAGGQSGATEDAFATTVSIDGESIDPADASEQVERLTEYVRATVVVKDHQLEFDPEHGGGATSSAELETYVADKGRELNDSDAASDVTDGANPMSSSCEETDSVSVDADVAESVDPSDGVDAGDVQAMETTYWKGNLVVSCGFVANYHFDAYATAQIQKGAGLGGGTGLAAGKAIAKKLGISAIPLIGPVLTAVAAGTAVY